MRNSEILSKQSKLLNDINIKNVTEEDIITIIKYNATHDELMIIVEIAEKIKKRSFQSKEPMWASMCMNLYFYKLGEMQGKRKERKRRKLR